MSDTTLSFNVLAKDNATRTIGKVGQSFGNLHMSVGKVTKGLLAVGPALAGLAVGAGIKQFIDDARESAKVGRLTAQVIKSTGGAARITADQVGDLATAISNKTGADDEAIQSGQNLLLTFTNIRNGVGKGNDIFNQASQAITDMTAALNDGEVTAEGMKTSSIQLGKALNDPIKGVTALQKVGVSFTAKQKEQIATLVKSGKTMEAQKLILKELGKEFGGAAAAAADPLTKLKTIVGNLSEQIGGYLLPWVDKFATFLGTTAIPAVSKFADMFAAKLGPKVKEAVGFFTGLGSKIVKAIGTIDVSGIGQSIVAGAAGWAKSLIGGFKSGIEKGDWKPLGKVISDGVVAALKGVSTASGKILDALGELIDKVDWGKLGGKISGAFLGLIHSIDWGKVGSALGGALVNAVQSAKDLSKKIGTAFRTLVNSVDWERIGHDSTAAIGKFIQGVDWIQLGKQLGLAVLGSLKINQQVFSQVTMSAGKLIEGMFKAIIEGMGKGRTWIVAKTKELGTYLWSGLKSGVVAGAKGIGPWLKSIIVDPVVNSVKAWFGVRSPSTVFAKIGTELLAGLKNGIVGGAKGIGSWVARTVVSPVVGAFAKAGTWLVQGGKNAVAGFKNGISAIGRGVGSFVGSSVVSPVVGAFSRAGTWLVQGGKNAIAGFKNGITTIAGGIGRWAYDHVISPVVAPFGKAGTWLNSAGRNVIAGFKNGMVTIWGDVTKWVGGIATWIKDHKGPVSLDGRLLIPAGKAIMSGFLKGLKSGAGPAWNFVQKVGGKTVSVLQGMFGGIGSNSLGVVGKGVERWRGVALEALRLTGSPASWINSLLRRMNQESGGNPQAINLWDSNAKHGDPSRGLMQTIGATFNAYKRSGVPASSIYDPLENIIAAINYANARYGAAPRGWDRAGGYEKGTPWVPTDGPAFLHKGEAVIPAKVNAARLNANSGTQTVVLRVESGGSRMDDFLAEMIRRYVRVNGGDVQAVFGRG